jgi:3-hydroxyacyl-[acyl-carrier-protein] dehydratase
MSDARTITQTLRIDGHHPSLPGHFPGQPVVPGVVLLDRIAAALEGAGAGRFKRIGVVKFLAPLLPEQDAELSATYDGARLSFHVERSGTPILKGEGELE